MTQVDIYSKPNCVQCTMTYRALDKAGIAYTVHDVTADEDAYNRVVALGYSAAPVVVVGDQHWSGFQPDRIAELTEEG